MEIVFAFGRVLTILFGGCELVSHLSRHVLPRDSHVYVMFMSTTYCLASTALCVHLVINYNNIAEIHNNNVVYSLYVICVSLQLV